MPAILTIPVKDSPDINVSVDKQGDVLLWSEGSNECFAFALEEWEKISLFVLERYWKMNKKQ